MKTFQQKSPHKNICCMKFENNILLRKCFNITHVSINICYKHGISFMLIYQVFSFYVSQWKSRVIKFSLNTTIYQVFLIIKKIMYLILICFSFYEIYFHARYRNRIEFILCFEIVKHILRGCLIF